jgi:alpha-beta hydrolase superfamily lysophospholipase
MEYALKAARSAFPFLGRQFATIGHSEGGGAVWSFAERMRTSPIDGYLGGVAISPVTRLLDLPQGNPIKALLVAATLPAIANIFPDFNISSVLTPEGSQRFALEQQTGGNVQATIALLLTMAGFPILNDGWEKNVYIQRFVNATGNGGKPIKGPLLIIQGDNDANIDVHTTTAAVEKTATINPKESISYAIYSNITHASAVWVGQQRYLNWMAKSFDGEVAPAGLVRDQVSSLRPWAKYQGDQNFYAVRATEFYQVPA